MSRKMVIVREGRAVRRAHAAAYAARAKAAGRNERRLVNGLLHGAVRRSGQRGHGRQNITFLSCPRGPRSLVVEGVRDAQGAGSDEHAGRLRHVLPGLCARATGDDEPQGLAPGRARRQDALRQPAERMVARSASPSSIDTAQDARLSRIFFNRTIKIYRAFEGFYGMEDTIERIVGYFKHAAQGLEEKRQILYLLGPVGGGKSSLAERLKDLMEKHPIYVLKAGDEISPVFESPSGPVPLRRTRLAARQNATASNVTA